VIADLVIGGFWDFFVAVGGFSQMVAKSVMSF
jgi:hypothetical protein